MIDLLKLLLLNQLKRCKITENTSGFTLIELLIAMVLAALIVTPLLSFMVDIVNTDSKEQSKATSEQEIQAALDYIASDLEQAVFIYDADGLTRDNNSVNTNNSGIKNQIPPIVPVVGCNDASKCQPVLVFWKREKKNNVVPFNSTTSTASCNASNCDDIFVYSLVGYYFIKDDSEPWSKAARIGRFQIQDGVKGANNTYIYNTDTENGRSSGFEVFNTTLKGNFKVKMNQWKKKDGESYTTEAKPRILLDYIDQSTDGVPQITCPLSTTDDPWQAVPDYNNAAVNNIFKTYSFYACVNSSKTAAQVFLRGNALARNKNSVTYSASNANHFPQGSIQVQGRGFLDAK